MCRHNRLPRARVYIAVIPNLLYTNTKSFILSHSTHETALTLRLCVVRIYIVQSKNLAYNNIYVYTKHVCIKLHVKRNDLYISQYVSDSRIQSLACRYFRARDDSLTFARSICSHSYAKYADYILLRICVIGLFHIVTIIITFTIRI